MEITIRDLNSLPCVYKGQNHLIYLMDKHASAKQMAIKILKPDYTVPHKLKSMTNEYNITRNLNVPGIRKSYKYTTIDERPALILEYIEGETLRKFFLKYRPSLSEILSVFISITEALNNIHSKHIIHRNISSTNIICHRLTGTIIDFGIAESDSYGDYFEISEVFTELLQYISPEQTGRINRAVDHRTDLYSLGIVFYEMLTGKLPFNTTAVSELIHCHIARNPVTVLEINAEVPAILSDIVAKLMAKAPQDRYQSACGLKIDLENCLKQVLHRGHIDSFEPGRHDISGVFHIPDKLYGRDIELKTLATAFEQVSNGQGAVIMVCGDSGTGKSSLIRELHQYVIKKKGYFIKGKYDEYQKNIPYHALTQAFSEFIELLLTESTLQLDRWKRDILEAIGSNIALLTEIIPKLELIVGKEPPVSSGDNGEVRDIFHHIFINFVKVIATREHPLVLFIDNLQWADMASLNLLRLLMKGIKNQYLLLIGSYRSSDTGISHPLIKIIGDLTDISTIYVGNMSVEVINNLVSDILKCEKSYSEALAILINEKTGGNALFVIQFLQSLYKEKILLFDPVMRKWKWDTEKIRTMDMTDNVLTLMKQEIRKLPANTSELLSMAACIGNRFTIEDLANIAGLSYQKTIDGISPAIKKRLILPSEKIHQSIMVPDINHGTGEKHHFEFLHERIKKVSYSIISRKNMKMIHLKLGRLQLQNTQETELEEKIFHITDHFNEGFQYINDEEEKIRLVELNLIAARKAKRASAYQSAIWYLSMGTGILPSNKWSEYYELTVSLYVEAVEAEYLSSNFERAELLSAEVLRHVIDLQTRIKIYEFIVLFYTIQNQNFMAIEAGMEALELLSLPLPSEDKKIKRETEKSMKDISDKIDKIEDIFYLPVMYDKDKLTVMRILMKLTSPACRVNPLLLQLIISRMIILSINHGNSPESAFAYGWYGAFLCCKYGDKEQGYRFGELSIKLLDLLNLSELEVRTRFLFNVLVRHWKDHMRETSRTLETLYKSDTKKWDIEYIYYSAIHHCSYLFCTGENLNKIRQKQMEHLQTIKQYRMEFHRYFIEIWAQTVSNFLGLSEDPCKLTGDILDETQRLPLWIEQNNLILIFCTYCCRTIVQYVFGKYTDAMTSAAMGEKYEKGMEGYVYTVELNFYYALALLANYYEEDGKKQKDILKKVALIQKKMKQWAYCSPANYKHKYDLIEAERAAISGNIQKAIEHYGIAIKGAREHGYIHEEAIAYECEGRFYLLSGREEFAEVCMKKARDRYNYWGATRKVQELEYRYKYLFIKKKGASMDMTAIINASHMLSQELRLEQLLQKMMHIVIENAGAEKGILIENKNNHMIIQARGTVEEKLVETMQGISMEKSGEVPVSVINYVARTMTHVLLHNAVHDSTYGNDKYIIEHQTKSLLCLPIMHHARLSGILYLENNLVSDVFTPARLELLKALSSQAAISMENAGLYANLEKTIEELKEAEEKTREANERYSSVLRAATVYSIIGTDQKGIINVFNEGAELLLGYQADEVINRMSPDSIHLPEEISLRASELGIKPGFEVLVLTAKEGKTETREWTYVHKDGSHIPVILSVTAIRDHHNNITGFLGIASDITKRKEAEQQKEKLYNQLLQAQKIESVGRLAGGVAHDFNNMLGVIIGYTELAMMDVLPYSSTYGQLKEILQAAQRSAELTRQLLAFARQQTAMPVITDINEIIAGMLKMLHRLIGENIDLVWKPGHALWKVKIDSTQFNQILANLVVNSRDAIDGTGNITLETDNTVIDSSYCAVHADFIPGEYVMLTVSDTGTGMTKEIIQHIFEPFFTTKEPGKGTGLGLATIYGIVRQNNGFINVYSEPGKGSIFKIYIPRCEGRTIQVLPEKVEAKSYSGIETVLISEDEEFYLNLCKTVLEKKGYKVIAATRPGQAISMAENYAGNIDLLITDIVMPEMNGLELFKKLRNIKSNIKCIYMSGYTANVIAHHGLLKEGVNFIQKPFSVKTLTEKVRNVLDEK